MAIALALKNYKEKGLVKTENQTQKINSIFVNAFVAFYFVSIYK